MLSPPDDASHPLARRFRDFVVAPNFPCVGAKAALGRGQMEIVVARDFTSAWDDLRIYPGLLDLARRYQAEPKLFQTFIAIFEQPRELSEESFEAHMWNRLQSLSDKDNWHGQPADPRVQSDPESPHFSLSFGGEAFFVVGLHPNASRPARRFEAPALVFNLHDQFEQLREQGRYEKLRENILARDLVLAGEPNPMLSRHGQSSEARQYSGRAVESDWACPFQPRDAA